MCASAVVREHCGSSWPVYIRRHSNEASAEQIADRIGVHAGTVRRWRSGKEQPRANHVIAFARAYDRPRLEALIVAGYLSTDEVERDRLIEIEAPLSELDAEELLGEIRRRMLSDDPPAVVEVDDVDRFLADMGGSAVENGFEERRER